MSEGFLIRRGGSSGGGQATGVCGIKASWPEGMKCVVSSGTKKIRAGKDATEWIFMLPFAGEWTVQAGELSQSVTVAEGEIKEVKLTDATVLYEIGNQATDLTGGWSKTGYSYGESGYSTYAPTFDDAGMHLKTNAAGTYSTISGTANAIDLTLAQTITVNVSAVQGTLWLIFNTAKVVWDTGMKKIAKITKTGETVVDISALSGAYYIAFVTFGSDTGLQTATVTSVKVGEMEVNWLYNGDKDKDAFLLTTQKQASSYTGVAPTFTDNGDSFTATLTYDGGYTSGAVLFAEKIDLTNVSTIYYDVKEQANKPVLWVGTSSSGAFNSCTSASKTVTATGVQGVSVSSLSGELYVGIKFAITSSGVTSSITVKRIGTV